MTVNVILSQGADPEILERPFTDVPHIHDHPRLQMDLNHGHSGLVCIAIRGSFVVRPFLELIGNHGDEMIGEKRLHVLRSTLWVTRRINLTPNLSLVTSRLISKSDASQQTDVSMTAPRRAQFVQYLEQKEILKCSCTQMFMYSNVHAVWLFEQLTALWTGLEAQLPIACDVEPPASFKAKKKYW